MLTASRDLTPARAFGARASRITLAILLVFLTPFLAAGIAMVVAGVRSAERGAAMAQWLPLVGFGGIFAVLPFGVGIAGIRSARKVAAESAVRAAHADEPWLWRKEWRDGVLVDRTTEQGMGMLLFAVLWNAIAFPLAIFVLRGPARNSRALIVLLFPAIGVAVAIAAAYQLLRAKKYGRSQLRVDRIPIQPGSRFHGEIETGVIEAPEKGFAMRLACIRRVVTGSGKQRHVSETELWKEEQTVGAFAAMRSPENTRIPFAFAVPENVQESDERYANDSIVWRLVASADVPGIDYRAIFELPVFRVVSSHGESEALTL